MAPTLAKFKRTSAGTTLASQKKPLPTIQNDQTQASMLAAIDSGKAKQQVRQENEYLNNMKEGLLTGKMNETTYYNNLANYYEGKMNSSKSKYDAQEYRIKMLTAQKSAKDAAESEASKARSQAEKAASAKYSDFQANISVAYNLIQTKLENGGYTSPAEYFTAKKELYDSVMAGLQEVVDNPNFSDASKRTAQKDMQVYKMQADNKYAGGEFGAVNYQGRNDNDYVFLQKDDGSIGVDEKPWFGKDQNNPNQSLDSNGQQYVKTSSGVWLQERKLVQHDPLTGVEYFFDPENGGAPIKIDPSMEPEKLKNYENAFGVYVKDPESNQMKLWITNDQVDNGLGGIKTNDKWHMFGDNSNFMDNPAFGLNVTKIESPSAGLEIPSMNLSDPGYKLSPLDNQSLNLGQDKLPDNQVKMEDIIAPKFKDNNPQTLADLQPKPSILDNAAEIPQFLQGVGDMAKQGYGRFKSFLKGL